MDRKGTDWSRKTKYLDQAEGMTLNIPIEDLNQRESSELDGLAARIAAMDPWRRLGYAPERIAVYLRNPEQDARRLAIIVEGVIAGVICLKYPWMRGVCIEMLAVLPSMQGLGLGARALDHVEREYRGRTRNIWLLVSAFNERALGFYQARGFKQIGEIKDFLVEGEDEILMRKVIRPIESHFLGRSE
ncbi:MAG: GNAT family N-acetyltransferase [Gammaproteobacteria bacterium]|nr:GNAT family N-acetyltransferase [Gammaproteobacteria bacterium]MBU1962021.1 GNAT family N-acetyltransferase [Gammaproteobacteria bacterium]